MTDTTEQAVVETPAPDANTATTVANTATAVTPDPSTGAVDTGESSERKDNVQRRIDKLTWQLRQTERERDYERELRLTSLQNREQPKPAESKQALKRLADFEYDEERYAEYVADVAADRAAQKLRDQQTTKETERNRKEKLAKFKELESKFKTDIDDYEDVAHYARIDDHVADLVMDMDEGPRIAYHLGKNPDIAAKLNSLSKDRVATELGRIDARLAFEREQAKAKPVSKAPPPPPKIEATEGATRISTTDPESDKLSDAEWVKAENARIARKAKRAAS